MALSKTDLSKIADIIKQNNKLLAADFRTEFATKDYLEENFATKEYIENNFATKGYIEENFATKEYIEENFATKEYIEKKFATKEYLEENFVTKTELNAKFEDLWIKMIDTFITKTEVYEYFATKKELKRVEERLIGVESMVIDIKVFLDTEFTVLQKRTEQHTMQIHNLTTKVNKAPQ